VIRDKDRFFDRFTNRFIDIHRDRYVDGYVAIVFFDILSIYLIGYNTQFVDNESIYTIRQLFVNGNVLIICIFYHHHHMLLLRLYEISAISTT